eukprot:8991332-Alexandrium_andersonii.AAC.1
MVWTAFRHLYRRYWHAHPGVRRADPSTSLARASASQTGTYTGLLLVSWLLPTKSTASRYVASWYWNA